MLNQNFSERQNKKSMYPLWVDVFLVTYLEKQSFEVRDNSPDTLSKSMNKRKIFKKIMKFLT